MEIFHSEIRGKKINEIDSLKKVLIFDDNGIVFLMYIYNQFPTCSKKWLKKKAKDYNNCVPNHNLTNSSRLFFMS